MAATQTKISSAQLHIMRGMQKGVSLHAHVVKGNAHPLWPTRSAWVQDYRNYSSRPGMTGIRVATLDALVRLGLVEEQERYRASTHTQQGFVWEAWTINYCLTERGKAALDARV